MRYSLRTFLIVAPLAGLLLFGNVWLVLGFTHGIDDAYAEWGATDLLIDYMEGHDGQWPPDWEALRNLYEQGGGRVGGWSFEKYQSRIYIDFDADVNELRRQSMQFDGPTFDVVGARLRTGAHMGEEPNVTLYEYFRSNEVK